jgi:hypothetical protein
MDLNLCNYSQGWYFNTGLPDHETSFINQLCCVWSSLRVRHIHRHIIIRKLRNSCLLEVWSAPWDALYGFPSVLLSVHLMQFGNTRSNLVWVPWSDVHGNALSQWWEFSSITPYSGAEENKREEKRREELGIGSERHYIRGRGQEKLFPVWKRILHHWH